MSTVARCCPKNSCRSYSQRRQACLDRTCKPFCRAWCASASCAGERKLSWRGQAATKSLDLKVFDSNIGWTRSQSRDHWSLSCTDGWDRQIPATPYLPLCNYTRPVSTSHVSICATTERPRTSTRSFSIRRASRKFYIPSTMPSANMVNQAQASWGFPSAEISLCVLQKNCQSQRWQSALP